MKKLYYLMKLDYHKNVISVKSLFIVFFFRLSAFFAQNKSRIIRFLGIPVRILYKFLIEFIMGIELPDKTVVGYGLAILHGVGLVVNSETRIGANVTLRQSTTIGHKNLCEKSPCIGDNVDIGANVVIIGDINIGENTIIGSGSVVVKSCPPNSVLAGNPAQIIKIRNNT